MHLCGKFWTLCKSIMHDLGKRHSSNPGVSLGFWACFCFSLLCTSKRTFICFDYFSQFMASHMYVWNYCNHFALACQCSIILGGGRNGGDACA